MSDIFDNIISKAKDLADMTGQKAGEIIDVSKIKISIADIKNAINKSYEEIGKYYYDQTVNNNDNSALIQTLIEDVNEKNQKLNELNEKYEQIKNIIICPNCKTKNESGSYYCSKCGEKIR